MKDCDGNCEKCPCNDDCDHILLGNEEKTATLFIGIIFIAFAMAMFLIGVCGLFCR